MTLEERQRRWRKKVLVGAGLSASVFALMACVPTPWYNSLMCAVIATELLLYAIIECITCRSMDINETKI